MHEKHDMKKAVSRQVDAIKYISGIRPFTMRRRIYSTIPGRVHTSGAASPSGGEAGLFILDMSTLDGNDVLG